jgi:hypothetical protein
MIPQFGCDSSLSKEQGFLKWGETPTKFRRSGADIPHLLIDFPREYRPLLATATSQDGMKATVWTKQNSLGEMVPHIAGIVSTGVATVALIYRSAWPTSVEILLMVCGALGVWVVLFGRFEMFGRLLATFWLGLLVLVELGRAGMEWGGDFNTFFAGTIMLYDFGRSPYAAPGVTAFPFPTFPLIRLLSLLGH